MKKEYITPEANVYEIEADDILDQANQTYTSVEDQNGNKDPLGRNDGNDGEGGEGGEGGFGGWAN